MPITRRSSRIPFRFSGPDAFKLLNDVVTGPLPQEPGPARWWALLSPQGKIQAEGLAGWADEALWLDVDTSVAESFIKRMRMYRLRAKVEIEDLRETHAVGWSPMVAEDETSGLAHVDQRAPGLGTRVIAPIKEAEGWIASDAAFLKARIAASIAELGPDFAPDTTFPHDIAMDILDGIDFDKGCYVGQEVVSRMKHRGTARRRPVLAINIPAGDNKTVLADGRDSGTLGASADGRAVAIVRLDRIDPEGTAFVGETPITLTLPAYANYVFGEAETAGAG
jgi:tRNA-modifying protein YgfZ